MFQFFSTLVKKIQKFSLLCIAKKFVEFSLSSVTGRCISLLLVNFMNDQFFYKSKFTSKYYTKLELERHCRLRYFFKNCL